MLISPLNSFPWVINGLVQAWVSLKRMQRYLHLENLNWLRYYSFNELESNQDTNDMLVELRDASFAWKTLDVARQSNLNATATATADESQNLLEVTPVLKYINLRIKRGQLIGVIGKVGAGKTSLLHAIIAELEKIDDTGKIRIDPLTCSQGFAYVSQEAWIQGSSIKENILFGNIFNQKLYTQVITSCALDSDLAMLPLGDETPVGENGICLSGGQKARLTLARACYAHLDKQIFILDDPLSAVDSHVAQHVFTNCIGQGLLAEKTRILCTHHVKFLINADLVVVLENGVVKESGPGCDVIPGYLAKEDRGMNGKTAFSRGDNGDEKSGEVGVESLAKVNEDMMNKLNEQEELKKDEEEKEHGIINYIIYKYYTKSVGIIMCILTILFLALMQGSKNLTDFWLSYWTQHHSGTSNSSITYSHTIKPEHRTTFILNPAQTHFYTPTGFIENGDENSSNDDTKYFFIIYISLCGANTLFTFVRAFLFAYSGILAGKRIHNTLITSLNRASLKFFDMTPRGRIINRLSSDMYAIDDALPFISNIFLACLFGLIGILVVTCYSLPWFSLILIPLFIIYYTIQNYYRWTSRELKRLSSVSLSPVYNHFHETIKGIITIRSFRKVSQFLTQHDFYLNNYIRASYSSMSAGQWLNFRLQSLSVAMITFVGFTAVFQHIYSGTANASLIGLALSYILSVTGYLNGLISSFTETEKEMVSVERAHQFSNLEPENWTGSDDTVLAPNWPVKPDIEFADVKLSYSSTGDNFALDGISFRVNAGEKIGICGRTGSGKSSLLMALFRAAEICEGEIRVDGKNIRKLNLQDLRERLSIIPQDPFLFKSTLRENLDPTGIKPDAELWSVLRDVHLDLKFRGSQDGLDSAIDEKGKNLSAGEKQLVCLARAILANRKIICIDEATASVDFETDSFIQETIRNKFKNVTVLTIAHRINTIFDYDRILVMNSGKVAEFDTVSTLLANKNSMFANLVNESRKMIKKQ